MKKMETIISMLIILITSTAFSEGTLQAEDATLFHAAIESTHSGYTGPGYVNLDNQTGSYLEWSVDVLSSCNADFTIVFANGGGSIRPMEILVNGSVAVSNVDFPSTDGWTSWSQVNVVLNLSAGSNTIRLISTGSDGGPNIDKMYFYIPGDPNTILGDANDDGVVDIVDALIIAQYYVGLNTGGLNTAAANVDCNNTIDIVDALLIAQYYVGLIIIFPPCYDT